MMQQITAMNIGQGVAEAIERAGGSVTVIRECVQTHGFGHIPGEYQVVFPEGTTHKQYNHDHGNSHSWMLPNEGDILSYHEEHRPPEDYDIVNAPSVPFMFVREDAKGRGYSERMGWETWKAEIFS